MRRREDDSDMSVMKASVLLLAAIALCHVGPSQAAGEDIAIVSSAVAGEIEAGGRLELRCQTAGLMASANFTVVWMHGAGVVSAGGRLVDPYNAAARYSLEVTSLPGRGDVSGDVEHRLAVAPVEPSDGGRYTCLLNRTDPVSPGSRVTVSSQAVDVDVLYFPDEASPACSPSGPVEVLEGAPLILRCSSRPGNPEVVMTVSGSGPVSGTWSEVRTADALLVRELRLGAGVAAPSDGLLFTCRIESSRFPAEARSCQLGPVSVRPSPGATSPPPSQSPTAAADPGQNEPAGPPDPTPSPTVGPHPACRAWFIAFLVAAGIAALAIVLNVGLLALRKMEKDRRAGKKQEQGGSVKTSNAVPEPESRVNVALQAD